MPGEKGMLKNIDTSWLMMAFAAVSILSYIFSLGLDALMKRDGFGPIGNAAVMTVGFFLALFGGNAYGIRFYTFSEGVIAGLIGAFALFSVLAVLKAGLNRIL